ncbi:hypothetical protein AB3X91_16315 [Paraburkholderia sp. BR14263]|uniref:hypothetical protein n=1 Tax=unclassified Paraburkholderia TaxID=2615204 RepID=UPI0034CE49C5
MAGLCGLFEFFRRSLSSQCIPSRAPETLRRRWESKARATIGHADIVVAMVGPKTHKAQLMVKEVAMARAAVVKIVQDSRRRAPNG